MGASGPSDITFYVAPEIREQIEVLSRGACLNMGQLAAAVLEYYRGLADAGEADRPEAARTGSPSRRGTQRLVVARQADLAQWIAGACDEWGTSRGLILAKAVRYYADAIKSGRVAVPAGQGARQAKPKPKKSAPSQPSPKGMPTAADRAECPVCLKQVSVSPEKSLLADHVAHPSVRPRGEFKLCDGSGQSPAGPIVHAADMTRRLI